MSVEDKFSEEIGGLISHLTLSSMKANYPEFVRVYAPDFDRADQAMVNLYGFNVWNDHREYVWQWYDREYTDDEE